MAETVGQHSVAAFTSPVNGTTPIDANTVRGNDNTVRSAYVDHDADPGIHVQSSSYASRPVAGTVGRKWITVNSGRYQLWYDDGSRWHEVASDAVNVDCLADANLTKGDVVKITGFNNGQNLPTVNKVSASTDTAFGIVENTVTSGNIVQIVNTGLIEDVDTNGYAVGTILYPNSSGGFTTTKPTSGSYQPAGYVLRGNTNNGVLYVEFSAPRIVERSDNTASTIVLRDASGNFSAGTITAGALTSTGLVTFASLKGTGATTVTNILDEDNMASDSATALATQQSIKAYVDAKVATVDTLAEVLANGNTTGANDIIVNAGQKIRTPLIASQNNATAITIADTTGALTFASALADSNLATISTAGKVANSATTATSANTASAIVARDSSGNFSAGTITAALTGNASTATALQTARTINGTSFDGTANITVTAAAGTLTGTTLASGVTASSLTSVGTLTSLTVGGKLTVNSSSEVAKFGSTSAVNTYVAFARDNTTLGYIGNAGGIMTGGGATDFGITSTGSRPLVFGTADLPRMSLDASGNLAVDTNTLYVDAANNRVGIGTATPAHRLDVAGSVASNGVEMMASDGSSNYLKVGNTLYIQAASTTLATIDNAGSVNFDSGTLYVDAANNRVGVGTASPSLPLDVRFSSNTTYSGASDSGNTLNLINTSTTDGTYSSIRFGLTGSTTASSVTLYGIHEGSGSAGFAIASRTSGTFSEKLRLDASGNLGLGVTPSAWGSATRALEVSTTSFRPSLSYVAGEAYLTHNAYYDGSNWKFTGSGYGATRFQCGVQGQFTWATTGNVAGTAGNNITFTQAMTLDASGNLLVGTTDVINKLAVQGDSTNAGIGVRRNTDNGFAAVLDYIKSRGSTASPTAVQSGDDIFQMRSVPYNGTGYSYLTSITTAVDGTFTSGQAPPTRVAFFTNAANGSPTERARITSGGFFKASNTGTYGGATSSYHEFSTDNTGSNDVAIFRHTSTTAQFGISITYTAASPNGTGNAFLTCYDNAGGSSVRAQFRSNGGLANYQANNVDLSDIRTKTDITPAESMWDKVAALEIVAYKYIDQTHDDVNLGVIAQQVETVEPVWVDSDGFGETPEGEEPLKTVYTKDITFAAIKALQEAMARIEALEARLEALEA